MLRSMLPRLTPLLLVAVAAGQRTWIVDANGGPGTQFTAIQPAVDAASPGDRILVRSGQYAPAVVTKGVALLAIGQVSIFLWSPIASPLAVINIPAAETAVVAGFDLGIVNALTPALLLRNNLGLVVIERTRASGPAFSNRGSPALWVENCRRVAVNRMDLQGQPALRCIDSILLVSSSIVLGLPAAVIPAVGYSWRSDAAVRADRSRLALAWCVLRGGAGVAGTTVIYEASPAAILNDSLTSVVGDATAECSGGLPPAGGQPVPAMLVQGGTLQIDPNVTVQAGGAVPPIAGTGSVTISRSPALRTAGVAPGQTLTATLFSEAGDVLVLAAALPGAPTATPFGDLWVDLGRMSLLAAAVQGSAQSWSHSEVVPGDPALRGLPLALQCVTFGTSGVLLSNPVLIVLD